MTAANTKHTPGPWRFSRWDEFGHPRFYVFQADCAPYTPGYSDVATLIAETIDADRVETQEANARLIAAAPELLEALRITATNIRSLGPAGALSQVYEPSQQWLATVDAAIAKATGEQQ